MPTFVTAVTIVSPGALAAPVVWSQETCGAVSAVLHTAHPYTVKKEMTRKTSNKPQHVYHLLYKVDMFTLNTVPREAQEKQDDAQLVWGMNISTLTVFTLSLHMFIYLLAELVGL